MGVLLCIYVVYLCVTLCVVRECEKNKQRKELINNVAMFYEYFRIYYFLNGSVNFSSFMFQFSDNLCVIGTSPTRTKKNINILNHVHEKETLIY